MRSIGRAIAVELARAGCHVVPVGSGRPPSTLPQEEIEADWHDVDSVADEIRQLGRRSLPVACDVGDPAAVDRLVSQVIDEFGHVDIVVNNAAAGNGPDRVPVIDMPVEVWDRVLHINLNGTFYVSRAFAQQMTASGGSIVNISTFGAKWMPPNAAAYVTSKAAALALTACMAQEVGQYGIRVNAVLPGMVETSRMDEMKASGVWQKMLAESVPLGRASNGDDIAWMVVFLCSEQGSWISGQAYNVDGGQAVYR